MEELFRFLGVVLMIVVAVAIAIFVPFYCGHWMLTQYFHAPDPVGACKCFWTWVVGGAVINAVVTICQIIAAIFK